MTRNITTRISATTMAALLGLSLVLAGCATKGQTGAGTGALLGATVGALTSKNKITGAALGAGAGLLLGYIVGNELDKADEKQIAQTLETTPSGQTTSWRNPDTGYTYQATPRPAYMENERIYRDVEIQSMVDGHPQTVTARAYREPDGSWHLVQ
ncbi:MAG: glycine zipper domain-containing protein [Desulfovibrionaceae bacterium]